MDWIYGQIVGFLGNFFALMGNMGVELFEPNWVAAIVLFFSCLGCAPVPLDFLLKMRYPKTKKQRNMYICAVRGIEWEG